MLLTLKQARLIRELTQEQVAELLGVHVQTYRKIEQDPDEATVKQAKTLSDKLNVDYNEIFFGNNSSLTR
ncbi:helix-turn-helix transcriptional regulator [Anaerotruncus rubiinfantis]|uniref:helix-turn-helix transcriptional regulator n=1 Tax=Anaerotruncus rubiinfantis TaxID=1720200 RepID=UPI0011C7E343|nr:helix-turn-helix transcriptional regulator [Anaerotruncus rubiinfantis]